jgi:hypothetical protein
MRDALREMIKNLAFERIESDNEEYVKYRSFIKKNPEDENSDYIIESKPLDEYVDDIYTAIDMALEEEKTETITWAVIVSSSIILCVLIYSLLFL